MNRLTKKCMIASAGLHALLIVALFVGSAFSSKKIEPSVPVIDLLNFTVTDQQTSGGGNPTVTEPPPPAPEPPPPAPPVAQNEPEQPQPEQPQPEPAKPEPEPEPPKPAPVVKQPDPPKLEPVKTKEPDFEVAKPKTPPKPAVTLKPVDRSPKKTVTAKPAEPKAKPLDLSKMVKRPAGSTTTTSPKPSTSTSNAKLASELSKNVGKFASSIRSGASSSTSVEMPGPGGEAFVNYRHLVAAIYERAYDRALLRAGEIGDRDDSVDVSIVIAKSGTVISSRITRKSGSPALNKLVQGILDSVDSVPGFPEAARDAQRSFNITFDLKSRRLTG